MKRLLFIIGGFFGFFESMAQITYTYQSPNSYNFSLSTFGQNPPLIQGAVNNLPGSLPAVSSAAFVFEYGDGSFTSNINPTHTYKTSGDKITVLSLSGRYDTIKPPPLFARKVTVANANSSATNQSILSAGQYLLLTPIANNLNRNDEMLYILTYRVPTGATNAKIAFFYNELTFQVFEDPNGNPTIVNSNTASDNGSSAIPRIREYFSESRQQPDNSNLASLVNNTPGFGNGFSGNNYQKNLSWDINAPIEYEERSIFLTIRTKNNLTNQANGYVEAALLYNIQDTTKGKKAGSSDGYNNRVISSVSTYVSELPHDPNYIIATPGCIQIKKGVNEKLVDFHIRCQNEGGGDAHRLDIKVKMNSRLKNSIDTLKPGSFKAIVGNRPVDIDVVTIDNDSTFFTLVIDDIDNIGQRNDMSLRSNQVANWLVNPLTWADIYFQLTVPVDIQADFSSSASIVFFPSNGPPMKAVETQPDTIFIRNSCTGMLFPRPSPLVDTTGKGGGTGGGTIIPPCNTCGCKKLGPLCWYWWLAIGLGTFIIIWAIARKKKNDKQIDPTVKY